MIEDIKTYINECTKYIMAKAGKNINVKNKTIISPLDRGVVDG